MTETVGRIVLEADARRIDSATKSLKDFESAAKKSEEAVNRHKQTMDGAGKTTANFIAVLERKLAVDGKSTASALKYDAALLSANKTQREYINTLIRQVDEQEKANSSMQKLTKSAGILAAGMAAVQTAFGASRSFLDFSRAITTVSTLIEGTDDQMKQLENSSLSLASTYGKMPVDQARTFYQVISSGIAEVDKATELLDASNKLSVAGFADLFATADSMTSIMNAYGSSIKSASDLSDILFVGTLAGKTTINELASSLGRVAPIAKELDVGIDELIASIAALTLGGISTAEAVTGMRAILAAVAKPSAEASKMANQLGIEFTTTALKTKGFAGFLEELKQKTGGSEQALSILFGGIEAIIPAMALAGEAGNKFNDILHQMENRVGVTQIALDKMVASPGMKMDKLMANISAAAIKLGDVLATVLLPIAEKISSVFNKLFGAEMQLSAIEKQKQAIASMTKELESMQNRLHIPVIGGLLFDKKQADLLSQSIEDGIADLKRLEAETVKVTKAEEKKEQTTTKLIDAQETLNRETKGTISESERYLKALTDEAAKIGKTAVELRKMEAAKLGLSKVADPLIDRIERESRAAEELAHDLRRVEQVTQSVITADERFAQTLRELDRLMGKGLSTDTYARAVARATDELKKSRGEIDKVGAKTNEFNDNWRTAWSNMEQTGRHAFTQFAAHGKSEIESIGYALKLSLFDMLYQITARPWLIRLGTSLEGNVAGVFGGGTNASGAASGGGLNIFSGGGFGQSVTGIIGRAGSSLPGSVGTFFGGMGGTAATAARGATTLWGASGLTGAASMGAGVGSMMGAAAGPLLGAYISTQILKSLAGDLRVGGGFGKFINKIGDIPILGDFLPMIPLINALFGRGPLKQKESTLSGAIGMEGFESGMLETRFKAKGGLFRSDKTDFTRIDAITGEIWTDNQKQLGEFAKEMGRASKEIFEAFNEAAKQTSKVLKDASGDLGLSTESLKDFNYQLKLVSEKGKGLTEEQIAEEIGKMSDAMAEKLIPNIADLAKTSETLIAAVGRLHAEFLAAENAVRILGGSLEASREYVRGMGFELRTAFMDAAGGAESFNQKMAFVSDNFLTAEQRFAMSTESLNDQLNKLGVPLNTTKEQFYQLLSAAGAAGDAIKFGWLLDVAPLFVEIADATKATNDALAEQKILRNQEMFWRNEQAKFDQAEITFATLQRSIEAERLTLANEYNKALKESELRIKGVAEAVDSLSDLSKFLKTSIQSLAPMNIEAARAQVQAAISTGDLNSPRLRDAITALAQPATEFANKLEAQRYTAKNLQLLQSLDTSTDAELLLQQRTLSALEEAKKRLETGFEAETKRLDDILKGAQDQLNALNRIDNSVLSVAAALSAFASAMQAANTAVRPNEVVGTSGYSGADILAFGRTHTPIETYRAAQHYGVSSAEIAASGLYTQAEIDQFVRDNKLASFDVGGKTRATGIAMLHKDEQVLTRGETTAMEKNLEEMKKAIEVLTITQNKMNRRFDKWDTEGLPDTRVA